MKCEKCEIKKWELRDKKSKWPFLVYMSQFWAIYIFITVFFSKKKSAELWELWDKVTIIFLIPWQKRLPYVYLLPQ